MTDYLQNLKKKFLKIYSKNKRLSNTVELVFETKALNILVSNLNVDSPEYRIIKMKIAHKTKDLTKIIDQRLRLLKVE